MSDRLSLDFLTAMDVPAADLVRLASDLGLGRVSLLVLPLPGFPDFQLDRPGPARRATETALRDTGVRLDMAEPFHIHDETPHDGLLHGFDIAAGLGARCVNLLARTADRGRLAQQMADACDAARQRGMDVVTEISRRGSLVALDDAAAFIRDNDLPMTVELDSLHFWRAGGRVPELGTNADLVGRIQICDVRPEIAPEDEWHEAVRDRALPGEGIADLIGFLRPLPRDAVIGIEIPQEGVPGPEAARRALAATTRLLEALGEDA